MTMFLVGDGVVLFCFVAHAGGVLTLGCVILTFKSDTLVSREGLTRDVIDCCCCYLVG